MQLRYNAGSRPQITFTSDFHELVHGDLFPGPCVLRYDPLRLVDIGAAARNHHNICAHVRFHPSGIEWQGSMALPPGIPLADQADISGQGFMLSTQFDIPEGCDELEVWFSCSHEGGETHWDSGYGKNFWLRFGLADIKHVAAEVKSDKAGTAAQDILEFEFTAKPCVECVSVRWWLANSPKAPRVTNRLTSEPTAGGYNTWATPTGGIPVPRGAVVAFDVVYRVKGRSFTDDNQGRWYVAD